ncbi:hypothetical protein KI387_016849, partial [Taxus chinensis]
MAKLGFVSFPPNAKACKGVSGVWEWFKTEIEMGRKDSKRKRKHNDVVEEASHTERGNTHTQNVSPLPKAVEQDRESIQIEYEFEETKTNFTEQRHVDGAVPTLGVPEKVGSEKNPGCNPEEKVPEKNPKGIISVTNQAPASMLTREAETNACIFQDPDILLTNTSIEEKIHVIHHNFRSNETCREVEASDEHNKPGNGAEDPQAPHSDTAGDIAPQDVQFFLSDGPPFIAICDYEHNELVDFNNVSDPTFIPDKGPSFNDNEYFSREVEINDFEEDAADVQGKHLACCNLATALASQNDALRNEVHGLKNEIASLSCQMFALEARCGKVDSTNQQLRCRIREYADLGSREEIIRCGEQIGQ